MGLRVVVLTADYPPDAWSGIGVAVQRQVEDLERLGVEVIVSRDGTAAVEHAGWVHVHSLALTEAALDLRRRLGARLVATVHTQPWLELQASPRRRFWLDAQTRLLASCDRVIFLSESERVAAEALFPSLPETCVIPNGVPLPPAELPGREERDLVVFAGRFAASKGLVLLEECIRRMRRRRNVRVLLAGGHGDGEGRAAVQRMAASGCEVAGWLSRAELDERFARALLVLVPSRYEPFGMVAIEAMRMGAPVVASDAGGLRDIVRDGSGGVRIAPADPQVWADEALRILASEERWAQLHRNGPAFVARNYHSIEIAARLLREGYAESVPSPHRVGRGPG